MNTVWAQRREEELRDCLVSPDVFTQMMERLGEFVVPYQHALETEPSGRHVSLYLQGLLSHLERTSGRLVVVNLFLLSTIALLPFSTSLIGGYGDGTLRPQGNARRSEAAAMLMRFCENLTK